MEGTCLKGLERRAQWKVPPARKEKAGPRPADALKRIRKRHADRLAFAADEDLVALLTLSRNLHDTVLEEDGYRACNRFAIGPPVDRADLFVKYADELSLQDIAYFDAVARAMENPVARNEPSDADWEAVGVAMLASGAPSPSHCKGRRRCDRRSRAPACFGGEPERSSKG